ncbi:MAG: indole-3-glycerol phosphate synthase TrpC [Candidatus Omnitrophica bacterium]|nr:indole-3-glycerol phosphate synthase TrpC [Candidatus Omnitrophota bacterium]
MHNVLSLILDAKKKKVAVLKKNRQALRSLVKKAPAPRSFSKALRRDKKISLIGEIKQASPSEGILRKEFDPFKIAQAYAKAKVNAISVLTEEEFFLGKLSYIESIKKKMNIPVLRKDFIIDEAQILEARAAGADSVLLIMSILKEEQFKKLYALAKELKMEPLVEVHTEKELKKVLQVGVEIVGVNNRNLHTLQVDLKKTEKLMPFIPADVVKVSESGIHSLKDVLLLKGLGVNAVLIGTAFMKADQIEEKVRELHPDRE